MRWIVASLALLGAVAVTLYLISDRIGLTEIGEYRSQDDPALYFRVGKDHRVASNAFGPSDVELKWFVDSDDGDLSLFEHPGRSDGRRWQIRPAGGLPLIYRRIRLIPYHQGPTIVFEKVK